MISPFKVDRGRLIWELNHGILDFGSRRARERIFREIGCLTVRSMPVVGAAVAIRTAVGEYLRVMRLAPAQIPVSATRFQHASYKRASTPQAPLLP